MPRVPLLTDTERENVASRLRNAQSSLQSGGLTAHQEKMLWEIYELDKSNRQSNLREARRRNKGGRLASSFAAGTYDGLAAVVGAPVDLVNSALSRIGLGSDRPVGGSDQLKDLARRISPRTVRHVFGPGRSETDRLGATASERVASRVGEEVGAGAGMFGALGAIARAGPATSAAGRALVNPIRNAPGSVAASEVASSVGAGAAAGAAREAGADTFGELGAGFFGAAAPAAVASGLGGIGRVAGRAATATGDALGIGNPEAKRARASDNAQQIVRQIMRDNASDPDGARHRIETYESRHGSREVPREVNFAVDEARLIPPAARADDPGLEALSQTLSATFPQVARSLYQSRTQIGRVLNQVKIMKNTGNPDVAARTANLWVEEASSIVQNNLTRVTNQIKAEMGDQPPEAIASRVRMAITAIRTEAYGSVQKAWDEVDPNGEANIISGIVKKRVKDIREGLAQVEELGAKEKRIYDTIENYPGTVKFNELMAARREINAEMQQTGNDQVRHRLGEVKSRIDDTLDTLLGYKYPTSVKARYKFAKEFHQRYSKIFRSGKMLQMRKEGVVGDIVGGETPASATLQRMLHSGQGSGEDAKHLKLALGGFVTENGTVTPGNVSPQNEGLIANYLTRMAYDASSDIHGTLVPQRFQRWLKNHEAVLGQFPEAKNRIGKLGGMIDQVNKLGLTQARVSQIVEDRAVTTMLGSNPEEAIDVVFKAADRGTRGARLYQTVKGDPEAERGLKQAFINWFERKFDSGDSDTVGNLIYKSGALSRFVKDPKNIRTMKNLGFSDKHLSRINKISTLADAYHKTTVANTFRPNLSALPGTPQVAGLTMTSLLSRFYAVSRGVVSPRFVASEVGSRVVGQVMNRFTREEVEALFARAMVDPKVAADMLVPMNEKTAAVMSSRLRLHLVSLGWRVNDEER